MGHIQVTKFQAMKEILVTKPVKCWFDLLAVSCWFSFTVVLVVDNKMLMSEEQFMLPIFLTLAHTLSSFACAELLIFSGWRSRTRLKDYRQALRVFALSQAHALSIVLTIASLKYVEVSFEQALSASTPAFTALLGYVVLGKVERIIVWMTLVPVIGGALVSMKGEPGASPIGVALIFTANSLRAMKSCLQELMLVDDMVCSVLLWGLGHGFLSLS